MKRIVLASGSPRRKALLSALGLQFDVITSGADEHFNGAPAEMVVSNACAKRDDVARGLDSDAVVIAADTLVFVDEHVLGKPKSLEEAKAMLRLLSGRSHEVLTGLALVDTTSGATQEGYEATTVTFRALTDAEISAFALAVNPVDRAGAYTVDGPGSLLVAAYGGCFYNVLGLPIVRLDALLRPLGLSLFTLMNAERALFL